MIASDPHDSDGPAARRSPSERAPIETDAQAAACFAALSDPSRLAILRALVHAGPEGIPAGGIARALGATPSRASFHLASLSRAGLVTSRKEARAVIYAVRLEALGELIRWLVEDCCPGAGPFHEGGR